MHLVFTLAEAATALKFSEQEFSERLPELYGLGFPRPVAGLGDRWSIIAVMNWVHASEKTRIDDLSKSAAALKLVRKDGITG